MRAAKGLVCLAHLLHHPGQRFVAVDLLALTVTPSAAAGVVAAPALSQESARVLVTKHIRGMVKKIQAYHPSLAHHLSTCIKTGAQCAYLPDPEQPLRWGN